MTGGRRHFFKRVLALSRVFDDIRQHHAYERIYHLDAKELGQLQAAIAATIGDLIGSDVEAADVIIDTPPRDKDRIETVQVVYPRSGHRVGWELPEVSKVVQGIAHDFIKVVKKIRIFVPDTVAPAVRNRQHAAELAILEAIAS